ncbi:MAG: hypothetical protein QX189_03005 [Methylococcales bacterium]
MKLPITIALIFLVGCTTNIQSENNKIELNRRMNAIKQIQSDEQEGKITHTQAVILDYKERETWGKTGRFIDYKTYVNDASVVDTQKETKNNWIKSICRTEANRHWNFSNGSSNSSDSRVTVRGMYKAHVSGIYKAYVDTPNHYGICTVTEDGDASITSFY